ncbi:thymidylate kinase [Actinomadura sp. KC06]|uniref:thymidylate kinase n=1 Tax=Actinomadura sp. KC06 TaxID=2530369 RepID=UPI0010467D79|nr:thymidylate kinase [Actinomadura sp. KC06]TDD31224.1 thymidylate kinase [Actinomadura sp. KC06]
MKARLDTALVTRARRAAGWVSLEGGNGVGKTYLAARAAALLGERCLHLQELPDSPADQIPGQVVAALHAVGDMWLRTGRPRTETLLLAALQVHRYEALPPHASHRMVLEDRGPHSVAVYQSVILTDPEDGDDGALRTAQSILAQIAAWRPLPDTAVLVVDDPDRRLARWRRRLGRPPSADELDLMARAVHLYDLLERTSPGTFQIVDRRELHEDACITAIVDACRAAARSGEEPTCQST